MFSVEPLNMAGTPEPSNTINKMPKAMRVTSTANQGPQCQHQHHYCQMKLTGLSPKDFKKNFSSSGPFL